MTWQTKEPDSTTKGRIGMNRSNGSRHREAIGNPDAGWKSLVAVMAGWWYRIARRVRAAVGTVDRERGDVPGWVMITLMSAILVAGLLFIAQPALERLFQSAMEQVQP